MGRSLQLLAQVGSPQFAKCVSPPSSFSSSSAPSLWTPTSTRKSGKSNVVVSLKDSAHTTGRAPQLGTGPAMTAMTGNTTVHAELITTTREKLRQRLTPLLLLNPSLSLMLMLMLMPSTATMGTAWGTHMGTAWDTPMVRATDIP